MNERRLAIPCCGLCLSPNGTLVGGSSYRLTDIIFLSSLPYLLRVWRQSVRAVTKELWLNLCERAANEQNPDKLLAMVRDINAALKI
jgi:hypothetical protein